MSDWDGKLRRSVEGAGLIFVLCVITLYLSLLIPVHYSKMKDADHGDEFIRQLQEDKEYSRSRARARVLFSDFQASRLVNADAYKSNASWWRRQIVLGAQRGILPGKDRCLIRGKDISRACVEGGLPEPLGLAAVLVCVQCIWLWRTND
jgi:hypothetical protein